MTENNGSGLHESLVSSAKWTRSWELLKPLENTGICSGVSAVEFKGKVYVFFIAEKVPGQLVLSYLLLGKSTDNALVVERLESIHGQGLTRHRPAVAVYDGHLFCFHTAVDKRVHYLVFSGTEWSHDAIVPGVLTDNAPSVANFENNLYLAVQGTYNGEFYHKVFENFEWRATINDPDITCKGSPSLCAYSHSLSVAVTGMDGTLALFHFAEHKWKLAYASPHYKVLGSPALYARKKYLVCASISDPDRHVVTETISEMSDGTPSREINMHLDKTLGKYLSEPCLIQYGEQFYLIGRRPCNDLAISVYKPPLIG